MYSAGHLLRSWGSRSPHEAACPSITSCFSRGRRVPSTSNIVETEPRSEASVRARPSKTLPPDIWHVLWARSLRAFGDGYVAILLPLHLARLGYDAFDVGIISTATLLGSALLTLAFGLVAYRIPRRRGLLAASLLMAAT